MNSSGFWDDEDDETAIWYLELDDEPDDEPEEDYEE